jgi:hypothetical protein
LCATGEQADKNASAFFSALVLMMAGFYHLYLAMRSLMKEVAGKELVPWSKREAVSAEQVQFHLKRYCYQRTLIHVTVSCQAAKLLCVKAGLDRIKD